MKLETSILPRRDGMVSVQGLDGKSYVFKPDAEGFLTGEVEDSGTVAHLLTLGTFYPANEDDHAEAAALITKPVPEEGDDLDETDDDEAMLDGLPIESNTPPQALPKGGLKTVKKFK